ncbi:hypothetical protein Tco_0797046 [Tanacetum coccineum]
MARPITCDYISATEKASSRVTAMEKWSKRNLLRLKESSCLKYAITLFKGWMEKMCAAKEWFTGECIDTVSTWDNLVENFILKFHDLCEYDEETDDEVYDPHTFDNVLKIFKIDDDLFHFDSPLCIAFEELNHFLKIDPDLFTYDIQGFMTYDEYEQELNKRTQGDEEPWSENRVQYQLCDHICEPYYFKNGKAKWPTCTSDIDGFCNGGELPGMVRVRTMTYFQDHSWYDELADGKLKDETLELKAKTEESWGNATLWVLKFYKWLKNCFENFHKLEYKGNNPHLDTNRIIGRNYEASNVGGTQGHDDDMDDPEFQTCKIRRFEMMKYSFHDGEEYISIKESEHLNHSKPSLDAYQELLCLINEGWVVTSPDEQDE